MCFFFVRSSGFRGVRVSGVGVSGVGAEGLMSCALGLPFNRSFEGRPDGM